MVGNCKLCKNEKELRQSHVLPEFMYQNLYDLQPKRFYALKIDLENNDKSQKRIQQKGVREYLLCGDCEVLLSKYEKYASETIYSKASANKAYIVKQEKTPDDQYFSYQYAGFSYKDFKIFLMSIFWRLIISETFNTPDIDEEITEKLRQSIENEDPLDYDDFACFLQIIKYKKGHIAGNFILDPFITQTGKTKILNILIDGFMYSFYLDSKSLSEDRKDIFLKPDGTMTIIGRILFHDKGLFERLKLAFGYFK